MTAEDKEILISRWDDPELTQTQKRALEKLLQEDEEGAMLWRQYQQLEVLLGRLPDELERVDFGVFRDRVSRATAAEPSGQVRRFNWRRWALPAATAAAAAAALLIVAVPWVFLSPEQPEVRTGEVPTAAVVQLAQPQSEYNNARHFHIVKLGQPKSGIASPEEASGEVICLAVTSGKSSESAQTSKSNSIFSFLFNGSS